MSNESELSETTQHEEVKNNANNNNDDDDDDGIVDNENEANNGDSHHITDEEESKIERIDEEKEEKEEKQYLENDDEESKIESVIIKQKFEEEMSSTQCVFDEQTGEQILQRDIPNKIIVARGKKISFYYERARRILRLFDGMIVTGFGSTVCIACSLVEVLKRNEMAVITHIETKLDYPMNYININENYNNPQQQQYYMTSPPQTAIEFHLNVGKYGKYLSGYHQRKIIELFEKYDNLTGLVSVKDVKSMNLYRVFHANNNQIVSAEQFINKYGENGQFELPDFIKFCSLIIHPLMKDNIFKKILYKNFKIGNYYNLLNKQISDNDMGINDNINDDQAMDQQINDNNVLERDQQNNNDNNNNNNNDNNNDQQNDNNNADQ